MDNRGTTGGAFADEGFANEPIDAEGLPRLQTERFEPLDPAYLRVKLIGAAVSLGIMLILTTAAAITLTSLGEPLRVPLAIGGVLLLLVIAAGVVQQMEARRTCYLVREHDLSVRRGIVRRSVTTAPFARIQDVRIDSGPIDRAFGLASLQARTAGGGVTIPGLAAETAERLKLLVADRAGVLANAEVDGELAQLNSSDR